MKRPELPWDGGCRCGQVRFRISAAPFMTLACHCTGCQRMSGGAFSLGISVVEAGFAVTAGEPVIGGMHGEIRHFHCPHCLSWMFTRPPGSYRMVNVRAPMLDEAGWFAPFIETCTAERLPWATTSAVHGFARFPAPEAWPGLMKEFEAWTD